MWKIRLVDLINKWPARSLALTGLSMYALAGTGTAQQRGVAPDSGTAMFRVEEAPRWTALFLRNRGWFGGDGIFSIPLRSPGGESDSVLWIFSDTMVGDVAGGKLQPGGRMIHNSVAYLAGHAPEADRLRFYNGTDSAGRAATLFVPRTPEARAGDYYWLGAGFSNASAGGDIYLFAYRMHNSDARDWSFRQVGNVLIVLKAGSHPPFTEQRQLETPFLLSGRDETDNASLGAGILDNTAAASVPSPDGYIYVYGVRGRAKEMIVARVRPGAFEDFASWRFWDGSHWQASMARAATVTDSVSNELSVSPLPDGRYALVFQVGGMGDQIGMRIGRTPYGPFGPIIRLWTCQESRHPHYFTYNAKAHPALSAPGELLVSYNVNAFDFTQEIRANPHLYRPRFIRVRLGAAFQASPRQ